MSFRVDGRGSDDMHVPSKTIIAISPHCVAALKIIMPDMSFHAGGRGCPCFDTANYMQLAKGTGAP